MEKNDRNERTVASVGDLCQKESRDLKLKQVEEVKASEANVDTTEAQGQETYAISIVHRGKRRQI